MRRVTNIPTAGPSTNRTVLPVLAGIFALLFFLFTPIKAQAAWCANCCCEPVNHGDTIPPSGNYCQGNLGGRDIIRHVLRQEHQLTTDHIIEEFEDQEEFLVNEQNPLDQSRVWGGYLLPAMMMMTEQLVHTAMYQMLTIGSMFDAKQQLETQTLFQRLVTEAHQDYHPSVDMCVFGTNVRSLAAAERNAEFTTFVLSQRSIDRQMGNENSEAARGDFDDTCFRLRQFRKRYCDMDDNEGKMLWICDPEKAASGAGAGAGAGGGQTVPIFFKECLATKHEITDETKDKDISYTRTVDRANTLDIDFYTKGQKDPSGDEQDVFALASNLYSPKVMTRLPETALKQRTSQDELLDMRSVIAKRAVAEQSFNTIVGMKSQGTEKSTKDTYPYMKVIMQTLGIGKDGNKHAKEELEYYLGDRPSYYAQMGVLTKKLYQSPDFFVNLYDEPVNVERKGVALQAIGLMQDFDTWNSYLRTEAMLSVMLELELLKLNKQVENALGGLRAGGIQL